MFGKKYRTQLQCKIEKKNLTSAHLTAIVSMYANHVVHGTVQDWAR